MKNSLVMTGLSPTIYLKDTDNRSGMIHMNSALMYFLNASGNGSENRLLASRGWGLEPGPFESPLSARLARPCPAHAVPRSSPLFAPRPRSTWVSLRTARQVVKPNVEELRARPARITCQVRVRTMQAGQTRSCWCVGAWMCAHTPGKRASLVRTAAAPPFRLPCPPPRPPLYTFLFGLRASLGRFLNPF